MEKRFGVMVDKLLHCLVCAKPGNILGECSDGTMFVTNIGMPLLILRGMRPENGTYATGIFAVEGFLLYRLNQRDVSGEFISCNKILPSSIRAWTKVVPVLSYSN